jgi:tight adherence protein B
MVLISWSIVFLGAYIALSHSTRYRNLSANEKIFKIIRNREILLLALVTTITLSITFFLTLLLTKNANISGAIAVVSGFLPRLIIKNRDRREAEVRRKSWPLILDQLSTATASGVSLHNALLEIVERGPSSLRNEFLAYRDAFLAEGSMEQALVKFVASAARRGSRSHLVRASQLKSTLLIARDYGGQEIGAILRNLSAHLRKQEAAYDEISIRQEWIKNSAILASATPWLLLLIISLNSQSKAAYSSSSGRIVLVIGLFISGISYFWIRKISESVVQSGNSNL